MEIETWNINSVFEAWEIYNNIQGMTRLEIEILGINEMRWRLSCERKITYYTGNEDNRLFSLQLKGSQWI